MVVAPPDHTGPSVRAGDERRALRVLRPDAIIAVAGGIAALALYLRTLAPSITMANGAGDSGLVGVRVGGAVSGFPSIPCMVVLAATRMPQRSDRRSYP